MNLGFALGVSFRLVAANKIIMDRDDEQAAQVG
jgi:hypothetical protein